MAQETGLQSQFNSYQRLKKWYLIPHFLTLSITKIWIKSGWSNLGKRVKPFLTLGVIAIEKGAFGSSSNEVANFLLLDDIKLVATFFLYKDKLRDFMFGVESIFNLDWHVPIFLNSKRCHIKNTQNFSTLKALQILKANALWVFKGNIQAMFTEKGVPVW